MFTHHVDDIKMLQIKSIDSLFWHWIGELKQLLWRSFPHFSHFLT